MSNVLLAVDHKENRRLLLDHLERRYTITLFESEYSLNEPFDLGVFDGHALDRLWRLVHLRKETAYPLFLPILLATSRQDVSMITRQLWRVIDEIIFTPVEKSELQVRLEVLLRARRLSLELEAKNIQLQQEVISHQEAEQALRESEERFQVVLKNSPIIVAHTDRNLHYTWIQNAQYIFDSKEVVGKRDDALLIKGAATELMELKRQVLESGKGARREIEMDINDENKVYDVTVEPISGDDGTVTGLTMAAFDATERKRVEEKALELAAMRERQRLARDLHDSVNQTLFTMNMLSESLPRMLGKNPERVPGQLEQLRALGQSAVAEMRTLLLELRPANLTQTSLLDLFTQLVHSVQTRREIQISCTVQIEQSLPEEVHIVLYRIVQESLNNIIKYSEATEASILMTAENEQIVLRIQDNGRGFNIEKASMGLGLGIMRERATIIGASFEIRSVEGQGTEILVSWSPAPSQISPAL